MNRLRQMSVFAHIVETGSISAAAQQLGLSKSVVSQHLKTLEAELGVVLLKRTTRRQLLTPPGHDFYQTCQQINTMATQAWHEARNSQLEPRGPVRITAPYALMEPLIAPVVGQLMQRYPQIKPELITDDGQLDLMAAGIDLAIRVGASPSSNLKQRRVGSFRDVLCGTASAVKPPDPASRRYIANHWQGEKIEHRFTAVAGEDIQCMEAIPDCRADSLPTCLALLEAGAGIGIVPGFLFKARAGRLVEVMPGYELPANPVYALHPYPDSLPLAVTVCLKAIELALQNSLSDE